MLRFIDGFDHYPDADIPFKWNENGGGTSPFGSWSRSMIAGRFGGQSESWAASDNGNSGIKTGWLGLFFPTPITSYVVTGFAWKYLSLNPGSFWAVLDGNGGLGLDLRHDSAMNVNLYRNGTFIATTSQPHPSSTSVWMQYEISFLASATAGWVEVRQNGALTLAYYSTGVSRASAVGNTTNTANNVGRLRYGFYVGTTSGVVNFAVDDIYVMDATGAYNNDSIGDCRIATLMPSGVGANNGFARTGGTSSGNYTAVNETIENQDTSYVSSNVAGTVDTYLYSALPSNVNSVRSVVAQYVARKDDAGTRRLGVRVRQSGTEADAPEAAGAGYLATNYTIPATVVMETNPVTGLPWTTGDLAVAEFGPKIAV